MANNVTNELTFSGCTEERFNEILNEIQLDEIGFGSIDFNKIIPEPQGFASDLACLNWRRDHWGTKWNSYGYADGADYNEEECQIRFKTANRNASKVIQELSQKYCDVFFTLRYADDNFGYHTGTKVIAFGETMDEYTPREGTYEAQLLAADIKKIDLVFDIESASGYVPSIDGSIMEYCEGVHVSQSFQCDASLGHPVVLCYDFDNEKVWLQMYPLLDEEDDMFERIDDSIRAWGIHPCKSWDDYNSYVQCLGDDAMEAAYHQEGGMTL